MDSAKKTYSPGTQDLRICNQLKVFMFIATMTIQITKYFRVESMTLPQAQHKIWKYVALAYQTATDREPNPQEVLISLNITVANRVYILAPQWNPSVESQAIGRVSRLGQSKPVSVTRYIVRGTVEVSMQSRQVRKVDLAKVGFQDGNLDNS
ncbi:hypothetical protein F5Y00DRAFT_257456 [Daldinia vernicosa]|uniref:uncharacterized protein n=1 Tax=Daldinia vernicosa TaxID=114800 RepID=UPI0020082EBA|nr:uncharacterized protein F5Y00DRAFT_257456 [Daldinia vernicosa]KAI0853434.1 hypothetical protein F5Y00DRAFT_257456 [Daldinia vernicosa]